MKAISKRWDVLVALGIACLFGFFVSHSVWEKISTELITFFGIQAAAVLPAMIFAAGLLRPQGLTLEEVRRYRSALERQMVFWITVLALDVISALLIIIGKAADWNLIISIPHVVNWLDVSGLFSAVTAFLVTLTCLRMIPMVKGISSLQKLNSEMTEQAIIKEHAGGNAYRDQRQPVAPFKKPEGYGRIKQASDNSDH